MTPAIKGLLVTILLALAFTAAGFGLKQYFKKNTPNYTKEFLTQMETAGAPNFNLPFVESGMFSLDSLKGQVTIVNFWATWCAPCVEEFPSMLKLLEKFPNDVRIVAVTVDEEKNDILSFLKAFSVDHPNLIVVRDVDRAVTEKWGTIKLPESYILDRDHKLVKKVAKSEDWANPLVFQYFEDIIKEKSVEGEGE